MPIVCQTPAQCNQKIAQTDLITFLNLHLQYGGKDGPADASVPPSGSSLKCFAGVDAAGVEAVAVETALSRRGGAGIIVTGSKVLLLRLPYDDGATPEADPTPAPAAVPVPTLYRL